MEFLRQVVEDGLIFGLLLGMPAALVAVVGLSRWHWFPRFSTPLIGAWLLIPTGAYPASLYFLLTGGQVLAVMTGVRWWRDRRTLETPRRQFSLRDLLLGTALIAAVCGLIVIAVRPHDTEFLTVLLSSIASSLIVLVTAGIKSRSSERRTTFVRAVIILSLWIITLVIATGVWHYARWFDPGGLHFLLHDPFLAAMAATTDVLFGSTVGLCVAVLVASFHGGETRSAWKIGLTQAAAGLLALAWLLLGGFFYYRLVRTIPAPAVDVPAPNGRDYFAAAGAQLASVTAPDPDVDPPAVMAEFVADHQGALSLVRDGLKLRCLVSLPWRETEDYLKNMDDMKHARTIAMCLRAEAIVRSNAGDYPGAMQSSVDGIRFAHQWSRGGLQLHYLVAAAMEPIGVAELARLRPHLDSGACRKALAQLMEVDAQREAVSQVVERDELWSAAAADWHTRIVAARDTLMHRPPGLRSFFYEDERRRDALRRLLMVELALQAFQVDHGVPPQSLQELIPDYLPSIPLDPYDGAPLRFKREGAARLAYSVGPDRDDDGGKLIAWLEMVTASDGDILLDVLAEKESAASHEASTNSDE